MTHEKDKEKNPHKKEKVLHARISESLDEEIRSHAGELGVSVSNLVRNVLQNAFGLVGDIVADTSNIAQATRRGAPEPQPADRGESTPSGPSPVDPVVLGWQEAVLNLNAVCDRCNSILPRGTKAAIALFDVPGPRAFRCLTCLAEDVTDEPESNDE